MHQNDNEMIKFFQSLAYPALKEVYRCLDPIDLFIFSYLWQNPDQHCYKSLKLKSISIQSNRKNAKIILTCFDGAEFEFLLDNVINLEGEPILLPAGGAMGEEDEVICSRASDKIQIPYQLFASVIIRLFMIYPKAPIKEFCITLTENDGLHNKKLRDAMIQVRDEVIKGPLSVDHLELNEYLKDGHEEAEVVDEMYQFLEGIRAREVRASIDHPINIPFAPIINADVYTSIDGDKWWPRGFLQTFKGREVDMIPDFQDLHEEANMFIKRWMVELDCPVEKVNIVTSDFTRWRVMENIQYFRKEQVMEISTMSCWMLYWIQRPGDLKMARVGVCDYVFRFDVDFEQSDREEFIYWEDDFSLTISEGTDDEDEEKSYKHPGGWMLGLSVMMVVFALVLSCLPPVLV